MPPQRSDEGYHIQKIKTDAPSLESCAATHLESMMTTAASLLLSVSRPSVLEGCHIPEDSMCSLNDSWPASDLKEESGLRDNGELHDSSLATTTRVLISVQELVSQASRIKHC